METVVEVQSRELPLQAEGLGEGCVHACIRGEALGRAGLVIRTGHTISLHLELC